jgi:hypothetical protein
MEGPGCHPRSMYYLVIKHGNGKSRGRERERERKKERKTERERERGRKRERERASGMPNDMVTAGNRASG